MGARVAARRRARAGRLRTPLFFVSGATGLVYQTIWARSLQLVFGTSQFAIATVLSAFMAGLAVGGLAMAVLLRTPTSMNAARSKAAVRFIVSKPPSGGDSDRPTANPTGVILALSTPSARHRFVLPVTQKR